MHAGWGWFVEDEDEFGLEDLLAALCFAQVCVCFCTGCNRCDNAPAATRLKLKRMHRRRKQGHRGPV
jgi:hypothetical protein